MKYRVYIRYLLFVQLICLILSCSSDLNTEQAKQFAIEPVYTTNLFNISAKESDFVYNGLPLPPVSQTLDVSFFENSFFQKDVLNAEILFRFKNTINSAVNFDIELQSGNGTLLKRIPLVANPSTGPEEITETVVVFKDADLQALKDTRHILYRIGIPPGAVLSEDSQKRVELATSLTTTLLLK